MGYVAFKIISIVKPNPHMGSKALSITLIVVVLVFLFSDFAFGSIRLPSPGYWLFILGVLSSAIFEWRNSMTDNVMADK